MGKISCKAKTANGAACRAAAGEGGLCYFHANPEKAKVLGQRGGRKNRRVPVDVQVPENMTLNDLRDLNAQAMRLLLTGKLQPRAASAFAQLSNSQQRVIQTDLEARVAELETRMAQEQSWTSMEMNDIPDRNEVFAVDDDDDGRTHDAVSAADRAMVPDQRGEEKSDLVIKDAVDETEGNMTTWSETEAGEEEQ